MFRKSFGGLVVLGVFAALGVLQSAHAADRMQTGMVPKLIVQGDGGIYIGFVLQPSDCAGEFKQAHAFLSKQNPDFTDLYALLATSKATATALTIIYTQAGDCTTAEGLLQLNAAR